MAYRIGGSHESRYRVIHRNGMAGRVVFSAIDHQRYEILAGFLINLIGIFRHTGAIIAKAPSPFLSCATLVGKRYHLSSPGLGRRVGEIYTHSFATHRNECAHST